MNKSICNFPTRSALVIGISVGEMVTRVFIEILGRTLKKKRAIIKSMLDFTPITGKRT